MKFPYFTINSIIIQAKIFLIDKASWLLYKFINTKREQIDLMVKFQSWAVLILLVVGLFFLSALRPNIQPVSTQVPGAKPNLLADAAGETHQAEPVIQKMAAPDKTSRIGQALSWVVYGTAVCSLLVVSTRQWLGMDLQGCVNPVLPDYGPFRHRVPLPVLGRQV